MASMPEDGEPKLNKLTSREFASETEDEAPKLNRLTSREFASEPADGGPKLNKLTSREITSALLPEGEPKLNTLTSREIASTCAEAEKVRTKNAIVNHTAKHHTRGADAAWKMPAYVRVEFTASHDWCSSKREILKEILRVPER